MLKLGGQVCIKTLLSSSVKSPIIDSVKKGNVILFNAQFVRNDSFFNRCSKEELWKGILSVSNAGKKKGRAKRKEKLHRMSFISDNALGQGTLRVSWPGLNTYVQKQNKIGDIIVDSVSQDKEKTFVQPPQKPRKHIRVHPLERGWSGRILGGKKLGPPKSFQNYSFENFESIILHHKSAPIMTSIFGRRREFTSIVATGNGNGLLGVAEVSKFDGKVAINVAQKRAAKKLLTIDLIEKHTVNHDFCSEYGKTKVFVFKKPEGFGLRCHRVITAICQLIGIKNLRAKVEGPSNVPNVIRAFIVGLLRQKTYQQIADEKKLHLVEFKEESYNFPLVLASPKDCLTLSEARRNPAVFDEYIMGNRVTYKPEPKIPFYEKLPSWRTHLLKTLFTRNHDKVVIDLHVKYGACNSHLTAIYPECVKPSEVYKPDQNTAE